jgi:hypothetical protein
MSETLDYLLRKNNVRAIADALSRLNIDSLKIQEKESLILLIGSENKSISNNEFPMHTALIFKEKTIVIDIGLREKGLVQPHYSIQHVEGYDFLCSK